MSDDVKQLLASLEQREFRYREVRREEEARKAAQSWGVEPFASVNVERVRPVAAPVVTFAGPAGTGRTTLAALVARLLAESGLRVLVIDLNPADALKKFFRPEELAGTVHATRTAARLWHGLGLVTHGEGDLGPDTVTPGWLPSRLATLVPTDCDLVLLDTPRAAHPLTVQAAGLSDECVVVADAAHLEPLAVEQVRALFAPAAARRTLAVNRYDALEKAQREALAAMGGLCGDTVVLHVVHADPAVREAAEKDKPLAEEAGESQVLADVQLLAEALADRHVKKDIGHKPGSRK